jgi:hypothetical protein
MFKLYWNKSLYFYLVKTLSNPDCLQTGQGKDLFIAQIIFQKIL